MTGFYEGTGGVSEPIPHDLNQHTDVSIDDTTLVDGQLLIYNATTELWENDADPAVLSLALVELTDVDIPAPTDGQVVSWSVADSKWVAATVSTDTPALALNDLTDVQISGVATGNRLNYDGSFWVNVENTTALASPITLGDGSDATDSLFILDSGSTATTDVDISAITFQHGGVESYQIKSDIQTGDVSATLSLGNATAGVNVISTGQVIVGNTNVPYTDYALTVAGDISGDSLLINTMICTSADFTTGCAVPEVPTNPNQAASKQYVDDQVASGGGDFVSLDTAQTVTGAKKFSSKTVIGGTGDPGAYDLFVDGGLGVTGDTVLGTVTTNGIVNTGAMSATSVSVSDLTPNTTGTLTSKSYVDGLNATNVKTSGTQTVTGAKTFSSATTQNLNHTGGAFTLSFSGLATGSNQYLRLGTSGAVFTSSTILAADVEVDPGVSLSSELTDIRVKYLAAKAKLDNMRAAFDGMADILNASPPQKLQLAALLNSLGIT